MCVKNASYLPMFRAQHKSLNDLQHITGWRRCCLSKFYRIMTVDRFSNIQLRHLLVNTVDYPESVLKSFIACVSGEFRPYERLVRLLLSSRCFSMALKLFWCFDKTFSIQFREFCLGRTYCRSDMAHTLKILTAVPPDTGDLLSPSHSGQV